MYQVFMNVLCLLLLFVAVEPLDKWVMQEGDLHSIKKKESGWNIPGITTDWDVRKAKTFVVYIKDQIKFAGLVIEENGIEKYRLHFTENTDIISWIKKSDGSNVELLYITNVHKVSNGALFRDRNRNFIILELPENYPLLQKLKDLWREYCQDKGHPKFNLDLPEMVMYRPVQYNDDKLYVYYRKDENVLCRAGPLPRESLQLHMGLTDDIINRIVERHKPRNICRSIGGNTFK